MKRTAVKSGAPYGVVGRGNAAKNILEYFRLLKVPCRAWHRSTGRRPEAVLSSCRTIFILIPDSGIAGFIAANPWLAGRRLVHFSGAFSYPGAAGLHPLAPLTAKLRDLDGYRSIVFAAEAGGPSLRDVAPELPNRCVRIRPADKPLYHALCAAGGNLPVLLWARAYRGLRALGLPGPAVLDYFQASLDNFKAAPEAALSGPIARGDARTVRSDLRALRGSTLRAVYAGLKRMHEGEK